MLIFSLHHLFARQYQRAKRSLVLAAVIADIAVLPGHF
jgi:hypothetical protein